MLEALPHQHPAASHEQDGFKPLGQNRTWSGSQSWKRKSYKGLIEMPVAGSIYKPIRVLVKEGRFD